MKVIPAKIIKSCAECPFAVGRPLRKESYCLQNHNIILESSTIPQWCPLEDYKEWLDKPDSTSETWWRKGHGWISFCHLTVMLNGEPCYHSVIPILRLDEYFKQDKWQKAIMPKKEE